MNNMIGQLQWFANDGDGDPDMQEDIAIGINAVRKGGSIQIQYPDQNGVTTLEFSLRDLMQQVCLSIGEAE